MEYCFVEFQVNDCKRFNALCEVFNEIKKDKKSEAIQTFPRPYWMR